MNFVSGFRVGFPNAVFLWPSRPGRGLLILLLLTPLTAPMPAWSQSRMDQDMPPGMQMPMGGESMVGMDMAPPMAMPMVGAFGPYAMSREASGTSWQPDSAPHTGFHVMADDWMVMAHFYVTGADDDQGGRRGGDKAFSASMAMLMA